MEPVKFPDEGIGAFYVENKSKGILNVIQVAVRNAYTTILTEHFALCS